MTNFDQDFEDWWAKRWIPSSMPIIDLSFKEIAFEAWKEALINDKRIWVIKHKHSEIVFSYGSNNKQETIEEFLRSQGQHPEFNTHIITVEEVWENAERQGYFIQKN